MTAVETPALLLHLDVVERNLAFMADRARTLPTHSLRIRKEPMKVNLRRAVERRRAARKATGVGPLGGSPAALLHCVAKRRGLNTCREIWYGVATHRRSVET